MKRIVIFASGSGSNAQRITEYFRERKTAQVVSVYCNNPKAYVAHRCQQLQLPFHLFSRHDFYETDTVLQQLEKENPDLIVLAGFLWLLPASFIQKYRNRIINVHPALLPAYGGKGMYGHHVHMAVIANREPLSGITIHLVNEEYDKGEILFQGKVEISEKDTADILAEKIHELEHRHFPVEIENYLLHSPLVNR